MNTPKFSPDHCMVDIETLGTRPGDTILAIGAVMFSVEKGIYSRFYSTISMTDSKEKGFKATRSTIEWWEKQDAALRNEVFSGIKSVEQVLQEFTAFFPPFGEVCVWGNGANFDNTLLSAAYRLMNMEQPWKYWNDRCYRTIKNMFLDERIDHIGKEHHALDDAITQATRLIRMSEKFGFQLK